MGEFETLCKPETKSRVCITVLKKPFIFLRLSELVHSAGSIKGNLFSSWFFPCQSSEKKLCFKILTLLGTQCLQVFLGLEKLLNGGISRVVNVTFGIWRGSHLWNIELTLNSLINDSRDDFCSGCYSQPAVFLKAAFLFFFFLNFVVDAKAMQWDFSLHDYAKLSKLNDVLTC